ncbi:MAG: DUF3575 domain-containing protein [Rikenellaceae bacterium]
MRKIIFLLLAIFAINTASAQFCSARINALAAMTGTLDVGLDVALTDNITLDVAARYNPICTESLALTHYGTEVGVKCWMFENFVGHFVGSQLGYTAYDVGNEARRYDGESFRWGVSYGYAWILSVHWNVAAEVGFGLRYSRDEEYDPTPDEWETEYIYHHKRITFSPTRIGLTFNYLF